VDAARHNSAFEWRSVILIAALFGALAGCSTTRTHLRAVHHYYDYEFTAARQDLRADAEQQRNEQWLLNNARLGLAALADGDVNEAERALGRMFDLLSTAGLNKDRTVAAVMLHEGVKIWKGEPFEQALMYHYVATLYATLGDWENARAAAANALFRLTDFGTDQSAQSLARRAARHDGYLDEGYTAVDTNFALGFLMQAIGSDLSGTAGAEAQFNAALDINPGLQPLVETLKAREYDTLLIVDYGKGPTKVAYGPDDALTRFVPQEPTSGALIVNVNDQTIGGFDGVCQVDQMAMDHRWNDLEEVRRAKSLIGNALMGGGALVAAHGRDTETKLAGLGLIAAGLLSKPGARADVRYLEMLPQSIFLVPLRLGETSDVQAMVEGDPGSRLGLPNVKPGKPGEPRAMYLRLHGRDSPDPAWLTARRLQYTNDHAGAPYGSKPWILGGRDVSTPTRETLQAYQADGELTDLTLADLKSLYRAENIVIGSGMENRPDTPRNPSFVHILEGGRGLFTPQPYSMGYKKLMYRVRPPYRPQSQRVRNTAERLRVQDIQDGSSSDDD